MYSEIYNDIKEFRYQIHFVGNLAELQDSNTEHYDNLISINCSPKWLMKVEDLEKYISRHLIIVFEKVKNIIKKHHLVYTQFYIDLSKIHGKACFKTKNILTHIQIRPKVVKL